MCGIAGEIRFDNTQPSAQNLMRFNEVQKDRGPDANNLIIHNRAGLAHTRLKIFDLSDEANQPFWSADKRYVMVFNGAIYNYKELRDKVPGDFHTASDTEVLLNAYLHWGDKCLDYIKGMYAFFVYDTKEEKFFAARDRLGIKPFYYIHSPKAFYFASTLPALLNIDEINLSWNKQALHHYFSFHTVIPGEHTLFNEIKKLPAGHCLKGNSRGDSESLRVEKYWDLNKIPAQEDMSESEALKETERLLIQAIERRMISDVEVGILLSGGLDSSLIVGILAQQNYKNFQTFSIGFTSHDKEEGNEFKYSDIIAKKFGTKHHKIEINDATTLDNLVSCIRSMSEPMMSHDAIGFYLLSKEVSKSVKVVQSGQGADEVFAGYHWYPKMNSVAYSEAFFDRSHEEVKKVLNFQDLDDYSSTFVNSVFADSAGKDGLDRALRIDTKVMLTDDPVKRVDNMTMRWGLEARVPFLDQDLVDFAFRIPSNIKLKKNDNKYVLKQIARKYVPDDVIDRPKGYFPVPALKYLKGDILNFVSSALTNEQALSRGLLNQDYIRHVLKSPEDHITPLNGSKLWQLAVLEIWLQEMRVEVK